MQIFRQLEKTITFKYIKKPIFGSLSVIGKYLARGDLITKLFNHKTDCCLWWYVPVTRGVWAEAGIFREVF